MANQRGLGRGLEALLGQAAKSGPAGSDGPGGSRGPGDPDARLIPLGSISVNPNQPRQVFKDEAIEDLAASIKSQGVLQPILVRPKRGGFELVSGERRLRASRLAGLEAIPAIVRDMSEEDSLAAALVENLQREDLNPVEEAQGLLKLQETCKLSQEELARTVGKSRPAVANALRLLGLPGDMRQALAQGDITAGHGRALLAVTDDTLRATLFSLVLARNMSVRDTEAAAAHVRETGALPASLSPCPTAAPARPKTQAGDPGLARIGERIAQVLGLKLAIKGDATKGQITLRYKSQEELGRLLRQLGVDGPGEEA